MSSKMMLLDWKAMKYYHKRIIMIPLLVLPISFLSPLGGIPMSTFLFYLFSLNPFAVEEQGELNNLYLTLPVDRLAIVTGRYMLSMIMGLAGFVMGVIIGGFFSILGFITMPFDPGSLFLMFGVSAIIFAAANIVMYPVLFKLGYQKGKMIGCYIPGILLSWLFSLSVVLDGIMDMNGARIPLVYAIAGQPFFVGAVLIIIAAIILYGSYSISIKVYDKRDF